MITTLFEERERLLKIENNPPRKDVLTGGRLLICYPDESVWDGAAELPSKDFFDIDDLPPWDTWCYYGIEERLSFEPSPFIVSWVPPDLIELAEEGINVNPVECIKWASGVNSEFTRTLKMEGLL